MVDVGVQLETLRDILQEHGYQAEVDPSGRCVQTCIDDVPFAVTFEAEKLGFFCFVDQRLLSVGAEGINELNKQFQFVKFLMDGNGDVVMNADFLFDMEDLEWREQFARVLGIWIAGLRELETLISPAREAA